MIASMKSQRLKNDHTSSISVSNPEKIPHFGQSEDDESDLNKQEYEA